MGLFYTKKDEEIAKLKRELDINNSKFDHIENLKNTIPEDCVEGPWCPGCEFVDAYHIYDRLAVGHLRIIYICGKGTSCRNFVQKEAKQ